MQELIIFQLKILWRIACVFDFSITVRIFSTQRQFYRKKEKEEERGKKNYMSRIFTARRFFFREPKLHSGCRGFANRTGNLGNVDIFLGRGVKRKRYESFGEKLSCGTTKTNRTGLELQQLLLLGRCSETFHSNVPQSSPRLATDAAYRSEGLISADGSNIWRRFHK